MAQLPEIQVLNGPVFDEGMPVSRVMSLGDGYVVGLIVPAQWTPALVSVLVSPEGDNYYPLVNGGTGDPVVFNVIPGTMINVDPNLLMMAAHIRFVSGTSGGEIPQEGVRQFYTVVRQVIASVAA